MRKKTGLLRTVWTASGEAVTYRVTDKKGRFLVIENAYWMRVSFGVRVLLYPRYIIPW
jgi:hypothetical protein